jgi:tight adherence protein C
MHIFTLIFGLLMAGSATFLILSLQGASRVRRRLSQSPGRTEPGLIRMAEQPPVLPRAFIKKCEQKLGIDKDSPKFKETKRSLAQAGYTSDRAMSIYLGIRLGMAVALPSLVLPWLLNQPWNKVLVLAALYLLLVAGYFLPSLVLGHLIAARQKKIRESLPDALDLMVVCVEAGQGLNAAMKRVAEEMQLSDPDLAGEILQVNLEINAGAERDQALRNLAERTGVEEVSSLCNILIQSDRFGTSIAQALKVQSETLRTTRRQKLEELAAKTPVKLVFPLLLFIFPTILVVILGPAMIRISENLLK